MFLQSNRTKNSNIFKKSLHSIGPMDEVMEVEQVVNKGHITNNLEIFMYIERNPFLIIN